MKHKAIFLKIKFSFFIPLSRKEKLKYPLVYNYFGEIMERRTLLKKTEEKLRVRVREGVTETEIQSLNTRQRSD